MTQPTFQELLTSQEARESANWFHPRVGNGTFWMNRYGDIFALNPDLDIVRSAIWQGYLQEVAPPPKPRVFKGAVYLNLLDGQGFSKIAYYDRKAADFAAKETQSKRLACVRVEITATEGQFDD